MSEMERKKGFLTAVVNVSGLSGEEMAEVICNTNGRKEKAKYTDTWLEQLDDDLSEEYYYSKEKDTIFKMHIQSKDIDEWEEVAKVNDDHYTFDCYYYNGGTCLSEILDNKVK